jgi:hypothetical protein
MRDSIAICVGAWLTLTMGTAAAVDFTEATARRGCSQEDAPALEIYLTRERFETRGEPDPPYLRFEIAGRDHTALIGQSIELAGLSRVGRDAAQPLARAEFNDRSPTHQWLRGTVRLERVEVDRPVEGAYDVEGDGEKWAGTFSARWIAGTGGCG